jgi:hypothetical protein
MALLTLWALSVRLKPSTTFSEAAHRR